MQANTINTGTAQMNIADFYTRCRDNFKELQPKGKKADQEPDFEKMSDLMEETVKGLMSYNKDYAARQYYKQLAAEFKLRIGDFSDTEKRLKDDKKQDQKNNLDASSSKIARVEEFITENYDLYFNEVNHKYIGRVKGEPEMEELKIANIWRDLELNHLKYSNSDLKLLLQTNFVNRINPFKEYFESLPPDDGIDHIDHLASYIKIANQPGSQEETERFRVQFKKMFVRSIASALELDFNKHCFTIVHEAQSSGKSTFLRWLCPPALKEYYSENAGISKDDRIALAENFWINIDELDVMGKYDVNSLKSLLSKDGFKERLPYAERTEFLKRKANFVASTNRREFLQDETGSVRWVCFLIEKIDWDYKTDCDINKIWAQAYHILNGVLNGSIYKYQLTVKEIEENERANRQFFLRTVEMDLINKYFHSVQPLNIEEKKGLHKGSPIQFLTATEIKEELIRRSLVKEHLSNVTIGKALKFLGFEQHTERFAGTDPIKGYWLKENKGQESWEKNYQNQF